ncbi:serine hydrolase FSH [Diplogelasinospora grovesii]|uniref:Serine hydrolase FSH n=1 Tax=Diplogelasinospora grovesii TaxID=303347 RepID=A0AAN6RYI4_9PEZI|nr:serine hydrolase FSH [Diplogelasinospora grovesii]
MRRVLALHGVGSSASILRDQLSPLITELGPGYEFIFLDGAVERERGPGMTLSYLGPFYSYTKGYTPAEIRDALDDLGEFIKDNGPFHGIIGFSQGASMAAAYLLDHHARQPDTPQPFGFAVFLSSVACFSPNEACYRSIVQDILDNNFVAVEPFPQGDFDKLPSKGRVFAGYLALTFKVAKVVGAVLPREDIAFFKHRAPKRIPRALHPSLTEERIKIPTVHVIGEADLPAMTEQSRLVCGLCDDSLARVHRHAGGHGVPSRKADVRTLAGSIEWAAEESACRGALHRALQGNLRPVL